MSRGPPCCRWEVEEKLATAPAQARASADMQRLKQQSAEGSAFLAASSSHGRARQQQDRGQSFLSWLRLF